MSAALLLSALGVGEATVLDDYELSAVYFTERQMAKLRPRLAEAGIGVERYRAVFARRAMAALLATLRERYGTVEGYLMERAGVTPRVLAGLRERLVEPPPSTKRTSSRATWPKPGNLGRAMSRPGAPLSPPAAVRKPSPDDPSPQHSGPPDHEVTA